ncbi:MAG: hypothetical protein K940chlam9_00085 [Chlamydiae bacterium]|nr:hypothetical protein [Chlamydiota bacterium]
MFWKRLTVFLILASFSVSCHRVPRDIEPCIEAPSHPKEIQREHRTHLYLPEEFSVSPFSNLTPEERATDWGKEYLIALIFADDFDLYRAITGFKRALCLLPEECQERRLEITYSIALAYFLGKKYVEVAYEVESTALAHVTEGFPAYQDLLLILYDSYCHLDKPEYATHILSLIEENDPAKAHCLNLLSAIKQADFEALHQEGTTCDEHAYVERVLYGYECEAKSIGQAMQLNALLPGAGYWYVGMKHTAVTAFAINALFIGAAVHFFSHGNIAAGVVTASLEGGWYFGGIYGAGYAAKAYNESIYSACAAKITQKEPLFPLFLIQYSF